MEGVLRPRAKSAAPRWHDACCTEQSFFSTPGLKARTVVSRCIPLSLDFCALQRFLGICSCHVYRRLPSCSDPWFAIRLPDCRRLGAFSLNLVEGLIRYCVTSFPRAVHPVKLKQFGHEFFVDHRAGFGHKFSEKLVAHLLWAGKPSLR